jgi:hypothetical protein
LKKTSAGKSSRKKHPSGTGQWQRLHERRKDQYFFSFHKTAAKSELQL